LMPLPLAVEAGACRWAAAQRECVHPFVLPPAGGNSSSGHLGPLSKQWALLAQLQNGAAMGCLNDKHAGGSEGGDSSLHSRAAGSQPPSQGALATA
jgi:hypothetical protein